MNQRGNVFRKTAGVDSFLVGDELLLYSVRARAMYRLNGSAAFIWDCIEDGLTYTAIRDQLMEVFSIDERRADTGRRRCCSAGNHLGCLTDST